jgi:hypothetical protein
MPIVSSASWMILRMSYGTTKIKLMVDKNELVHPALNHRSRFSARYDNRMEKCQLLKLFHKRRIDIN